MFSTDQRLVRGGVEKVAGFVRWCPESSVHCFHVGDAAGAVTGGRGARDERGGEDELVHHVDAGVGSVEICRKKTHKEERMEQTSVGCVPLAGGQAGMGLGLAGGGRRAAGSGDVPEDGVERRRDREL